MSTISPTQPKRRLQNRLNDLSWKEWLVFQKSFFAMETDDSLYAEMIRFFTKEAGRILVIDISESPPLALETHGRHLLHQSIAPHDIGRWSDDISAVDFLIIDTRRSGNALTDQIIHDPESLRTFLMRCRSHLQDEAFGVLLSQEIDTDQGRYPLPWVLSHLARGIFRLRDERIGLEGPEDRPVYVNVLQAIPEIGPVSHEVPSLRVNTPAFSLQWVKPKPKPRRAHERLHPAKFPEDLVRTFITAFTEKGEVVLDPMGGTGSAAVAAILEDRQAVIVELSKTWATMAQARIADTAGLFAQDHWLVIHGDARTMAQHIPESFQPIAYTITSPPYWRILHNPGMHVADEGQKARVAHGLPTTYSDSDADFGNIGDYTQFIDELAEIYTTCAEMMNPGRILTIVTKNVKVERAQYPIAWDLVFKLCGPNGRFDYAGTTFWCQDDVGLKPFGMGMDWVSNILHNYCVHLRVR